MIKEVFGFGGKEEGDGGGNLLSGDSQEPCNIYVASLKTLKMLCFCETTSSISGFYSEIF